MIFLAMKHKISQMTELVVVCSVVLYLDFGNNYIEIGKGGERGGGLQ